MNIFHILLDIPKTFYFNFKYFGIKGIVKLPVRVSRKVHFLSLKGRVIIEKEMKFGMIQIGFREVGIFDLKYKRTIWEVSGDVIFKGNALIGHGSSISVGNNAILNVGNNFVITSSSSIVCFKNISFGDDCLLSWDILVIDTDFHKVKLSENSYSVSKNDISIGNKNWIGCRVTILKGTVIFDENVIGASSLLNKKYNCSQKLIAGNPAVPVKDILGWEK